MVKKILSFLFYGFLTQNTDQIHSLKLCFRQTHPKYNQKNLFKITKPEDIFNRTSSVPIGK